MPFYEYRCETCGGVVTARQGMGEGALERCGDRCVALDPALRGQGRLVKMLSRTNVGRSAGTAGGPPPMQPCANCPGAESGQCGMART